MHKTPIIFDTDPGIDDAAAISILLTNPAFDVKLMTSVAGNVTVDKTTTNILKLAHFFNRQDIKVARGAEKPLVKKFEDASHIHGESGMPGYDFGEVQTTILDLSAVDAMVEVLQSSPEKVTVVAVGAFTNIANLITQHPEVLSKIERLVVMGGSLSGGNMTSVAEFNVFTDPDAAKIVFNSGLDITMIGLDVTLKALISGDTVAKLQGANETGRMLTAMMAFYGDNEETGKPMHDVNTLYYLLHPESYQLVDYWVDVVTDGPAIGGTVADIRHAYHDKHNVHVALGVDRPAFEQWFIAAIGQISDEQINMGKVEI